MNVSKRAPRSGGRTVAHETVGNTALSARASDSTDERASGTPRLRVAPPLPVAVPRAPFIALILVLVVGGVLGILVVNTKINQNAFRLAELQKQQADLNIQEQRLEQQIARAENPGNLTAEALKLGLVQGTPVQIELPDGRLIGMMTPAGDTPSNASQQGAGG